MIQAPTERHTQFLKLKSSRHLCYSEYGAERGIPLIYFHGWPSSRLQARTLDALGKELGVTVYALDRPGVGQSDHHKGRVLHDMPSVIEEFASQLNLTPPFHLLGISGGGPYALATACALDSQIASTSIVSGAPPLAEFNDKREMILPYRVLLKLRPIMPAIIKPALPFTKWVASKTYQEPPLSWFVQTLAPADQKIFLEDDATLFALHSFREAFTCDAPGLITDADAYSSPWDLDYSKINHPVHFWHGTEDQNIPFKMAKYLASQVPNAIPHWLSGEGHYTVPIKYGREFLSAVL